MDVHSGHINLLDGSHVLYSISNPLFPASYMSDWKNKRISLPDDIWVGGIDLPQYCPSTTFSWNRPSLMVKDSYNKLE